MAGASYELYLYEPDNTLSGVIARFEQLDYVLATNEIGTAIVTISGQYSGDIDEDYRLEIYRDGALVGDTQFFVSEYAVILDDSGQYTTKITAVSALGILDWPIVNYAPGTLESHHTDYAGNVIKQVVRQNIGNLASDAARDMSTNLDVQADADDGAAVTVDVGWTRLWAAVRDVIGASRDAGTEIIVDIVKNGSGKLELQTFSDQRGDDLSASVVLSPERGTLRTPRLDKIYAKSASRAIVGGTGQEIWRNVVEVSNVAQVNNTPFGYIKEHFVAEKRATTTTEASQYGDIYLAQNRNKMILSGKPAQSGAAVYGTDYNFGDLVTIEFLGYVAVVSIDRVKVSLRNGIEMIDISMRGDVVS